MATPAQLAANRENSKKSTGPRSDEGKKRSAANNFRHGFRAQSTLAPGDDPVEFQALLDQLAGHFCTCDLIEERAVREMADAEWRLRRVRRQIEDLHWDEFEKTQTQFPDFSQSRLELRTLEALHQPGALFPRLLTYEAKSERQYDRAYRAWRNYQHDRIDAESKQVHTMVRCIQAGLPDPGSISLAHAAPDSLPTRTNEPNSAPAATSQNRTVEPNPAPATAQNRTNEANSAPVTTQNRTFEPNSAPAATQNGTNEPNSKAPATPRNAPCPCGSGQKFKRCCGRNAPPVLFPAAQAA